MGSPPPKPLLVFDGDCGFCRYWIGRWRAATADLVEYAPYQDAAARFPEIPAESFRRAVQLVEPDGSVSEGAEAVFRALAKAPGRGGPLWCYERLPGFAAATEGAYGVVAAHRPAFSKATLWLWGKGDLPSSYSVTRRAYLIGLSIVYLIAFASLGLQIDGLAGERGILPAGEYLQAARRRYGAEAYLLLPSLAWVRSDGAFLEGLCAAGAGVSLAAAAGLAPALCMALLWILYLSAAVVCRDFLNFQWDALLLEAGLLAIFLAPARLRFDASRERAPSPAALFLTRWLLFRLMFTSGIVKLASGDETWWDLTALTVHYETQPIPTWTAWYVHQLPGWFHRASCAAMFTAELAVPLLIFLPRRPRLLGFWALAGFQAVLIATGNYAFFNILAIVLCLPLLDDAAWPGIVRRALGGRAGGGAGDASGIAPQEAGEPPEAPSRRRRAARLAGWLLAAVAAWLGAVSALARARLISGFPPPARAIYEWIAPFRSLNAYGLFANMTTERPEIVVEGSDDGLTWLPYEFRWKPGEPTRPPPFVAPHQPRLDWQMWFAALAPSCRQTPWFGAFERRLLEGSPEVLALMERNPFPDRPPRLVRALLYEYRFTDVDARRRDGTWWRRELKGLYCPPASLR